MADEMDYKLELELLRNKLERLLEVTENLVDSEVVSLSQELDKLILNYYFLDGVGSISQWKSKLLTLILFILIFTQGVFVTLTFLI